MGLGCVLAVVLAHLVDLSGWIHPHLGTDVLHVLAFAVVGFMVVRSLWARGMTSRITAALLTLVASFLLGLLGEAAQLVTARDADWEDIVRDLLGAGAGVAVATAIVSKRGVLRLVFGATAALLILIGAAPTIAESLAWWSAERHFPVLDDFEHRVQRRLWRSTGARITYRSHGYGAALCGTFAEGRYPGAARRVPRDWRGYGSLEFTVDTQEATDLVIRIHDTQHDGRHADRFNRTVRLSTGRQRLSIPLDAVRQGPRGRELALAQVQELIVFVPRPARPITVCFDDFILIP